jgi:hypothetical protein
MGTHNLFHALVVHEDILANQKPLSRKKSIPKSSGWFWGGCILTAIGGKFIKIPWFPGFFCLFITGFAVGLYLKTHFKQRPPQKIISPAR